MFEKGLIYRGKRLVNWDPHFETAISDLEVENTEVAGHMWHFKYPLAGGATYTYVERDEDGNVTLEEERDYISIATTHPETMLGDGAVAVHPSDERYAPNRRKTLRNSRWSERAPPPDPDHHRRYPTPISDRARSRSPGAHDFNDYAVAQRGGIPMYRLMDTRGAMRDDGPAYARMAEIAMAVAKGERTLTEAEADTINLVPDDLRGLDRFEAREKVVRQITDEGLAVNVENDQGETVPLVENKPIMQPFGDRSKVVIEPMLTDQWFVATDKIVGPAIEAVKSGEVTILPEQDRKVYFNWLENIEPWCISRQLWWGHQIPVWYGFDLAAPDFRDAEGDGALDLVEMLDVLNESHFAPLMECGHDFEATAQAFAAQLTDLPTPLQSMTVVEAKDREDALHPAASSLADYTASQDPTHLVYPVWRDPDVLDTWFSSGLWPIGTLGWPEKTPELGKYFPTSVLVTGFDIIFFWVARMMMMQYAVVGEKPFSDVYVHALVRDEKGKKMSKSLGNVLDPLELIDDYGADAVRFTLTAMAAMGRDLKLSPQRIAGYRNFGTKLWNAARFAEMNEAVGSTGAIPQPKQTVNRWILGETAKTKALVDTALSQYRFNDAANTLYAFVWGTVCDWYVEFSKPLLLDGTGEVKRETQDTMAWVIDQCLILLHPIMPFITEELWGTLAKREGMLIHADWPTYGDELIDAEADAEMNWVIALIDSVRSAARKCTCPWDSTRHSS